MASTGDCTLRNGETITAVWDVTALVPGGASITAAVVTERGSRPPTGTVLAVGAVVQPGLAVAAPSLHNSASPASYAVWADLTAGTNYVAGWAYLVDCAITLTGGLHLPPQAIAVTVLAAAG